jgi:hypothetical protein
MARVNLLCVFGIILAASSVAILWVPLFFSNTVGGSGDSDLDRQLRSALSTTSALFILGTIVSIFTPLGGLLNIPALIFTPMFLARGDFAMDLEPSNPNAGVMVLLLAGVIGTCCIIVSLLMQVNIGAGEDPIPRFRTFRGSDAQPSEREEGRKEVQLILLKSKLRPRTVAIVALLAFALVGITVFEVFTEPVSSLQIGIVIDGEEYGPGWVGLYLDGQAVALESYDMSDLVGGIYYADHSYRVEPGKHTFGMDFTNTSEAGLDGVLEQLRSIWVIPFTDETQEILWGVLYI